MILVNLGYPSQPLHHVVVGTAVICLGDFNAQLVRDQKGVMGQHCLRSDYDSFKVAEQRQAS